MGARETGLQIGQEAWTRKRETVTGSSAVSSWLPVYPEIEGSSSVHDILVQAVILQYSIPRGMFLLVLRFALLWQKEEVFECSENEMLKSLGVLSEWNFPEIRMNIH